MTDWEKIMISDFNIYRGKRVRVMTTGHEDRLVPDCLRTLSAGKAIPVRNPDFTRLGNSCSFGLDERHTWPGGIDPRLGGLRPSGLWELAAVGDGDHLRRERSDLSQLTCANCASVFSAFTLSPRLAMGFKANDPCLGDFGGGHQARQMHVIFIKV